MTSKEFHLTKKQGFWKDRRKNTKGQSNKTCPKKNHTSVQNQSVMGDLKDSGDGYVLTPVDKTMATCHLFAKHMHPLSLSIVRILIMATCLKILLMTFLYILELRRQKITNAYHQLVGFLSYIKTEPKVYLLL